jgi:ankyrin repeat protein
VASRSTRSLDRMAFREDWFRAERLHRAAAEGDIAAARALIAEGVPLCDFDDIGYTPLHYAAREGHHAMVELLLSAGADVNAREEESNSNTAVSVAASHGTPEMVEFLLARGARPDIPGWMGIDAYLAAQERRDDDAPQVRAVLNEFRRRQNAV